MRSYISILETPGALLLLMTALFLLIGQTTVFILALRTNQGRRRILSVSLPLLAGFLVFVIMLDGYDIVNYPQITRNAVHSDWLV